MPLLLDWLERLPPEMRGGDVIMASPLASALGVLDISGATHLPTRYVQGLAGTSSAIVVLHKEAESEATWGDDFEV